MSCNNAVPTPFNSTSIEYGKFNSSLNPHEINTIEQAAELIASTYNLPSANVVYKYSPNVITNDGTWHFIDKTTGISYSYDYYFTKTVSKQTNTLGCNII